MSYLDDTFLGAPAEDATTQVGSAGDLPELGDEPNLPAPAAPKMVRLPGNITMPTSTALVLVAVAIAIAIWIYRSRSKKRSE